MSPEEPRRFLIAVGVETYGSKAWARLEHVPHEIARIVDLLTDSRYRLKRVLKAESKRPQREPFLTGLFAWVSDSHRRPGDHLVLYWTGHGAVRNERLYLVLPGTAKVEVDGLKVEDIATVILGAESRLGPVLLLLDVCYAAEGGIDVAGLLGALTRQRHRDLPPEISIICATGSRAQAKQLVFADAFADAVLSCEEPDKHLPPTLNLFSVADKMEGLLRSSGQRPYLHIATSPGSCGFLRNPYHVPHWPLEIDLATQRLLKHLDPPARGVARPDAAGWYFKGRRKVFAELCQWLRSEARTGLCRVTGSIGAGKSAVLGRLYTLNRADYLDQIPSEVLAETEIPPIGSIDAAVLLPEKTLRDVIKEISRALRVVAETKEQLVSALEARERPTVLLVDGLDETIAPNNTRELLESLAQTMRVIVGTRPLSSQWLMQPEIDINLDREPWADLDAVESYVLARLRDELRDRTAIFGSWQEDLDGTARSLAKRAGGNFLLASLTVTALIAGTAGDPRRQEWHFPDEAGQAFDLIFGALGDDEDNIRDLLLPLAYAEDKGLPRGPLWLTLATKLSSRKDPKLDIGDVSEKVPWFITEGLMIGQDPSFGRSVWHLFHAALSEHLQKGRADEQVHPQFVAALQRMLASVKFSGPSASDDVAYASRNLSRHMRRAGEWRALGRLVIAPSWITRQSRPSPFASLDYASDIEEARAAANQVNLGAAEAGRQVPGLAATVWRLLWRSGLVTLAEKIPPMGWALLVRKKRITPEIALRAVAALGNEDLRASRFAALAPVYGKNNLDDLLDFAEGVKGISDEMTAEQRTEPDRPPPIGQYERILREALSSSDARGIADRVLGTASRLGDYPRWFVLEGLLPHLNEDQLVVAGQLIQGMKPDGRFGWWRSLAFAAYMAERARRGDQAAVRETTSGARNSLSWWFALAALFALRKAGNQVDLAGVSLTRELARAEDDVEDWLHLVEVMTALIGALPNVATKPRRTALAAYLRRLRNRSSPDAKIRLAADAGQHLPNPHGLRLLRWAKARLKSRLSLDYANINWFHTPPALAVAFARKGELANALEVVSRTEDHPYYRPKALADVVRSFEPAGHENRQAVSKLIYEYCLERSPTEKLQLLSAGYDWLSDDEQDEVVETIGGLGLSLSDDIREARCHVQGALARYARPDDIGRFSREFLTLVAPVAKYSRIGLLELFARNCAAAGHAGIALETLTRIESPFQAEAWGQVLSHASEVAVKPLLQALAHDEHLLSEILDDTTASDALVAVVSRISSDLLKTLETAATTRPWYRRAEQAYDLWSALAVRGFELGDENLATRALSNCMDSLDVLKEARRMPLKKRRRFHELLNANPRSSASTEREALAGAIGRLLGATPTQIAAASNSLADTVEAESLVSAFEIAGPWLVELLSSSARARLVNMTFETQLKQAGNDWFRLERLCEWRLPWLEGEQIDRLIEAARGFKDDYERDNAIVSVLPRFADLRGCSEALSLRNSVRRSDHRAASWAAVWRHLTDKQRVEAFAILTPKDPWKDEHQASALGKIAHLLREYELLQATRWLLNNHGGDEAHLLRPFIDAARQRPRKQAYEVWDAIMTELARRPCADAMAYFSVAVPLAEYLGGKNGLVTLDHFLSRAAEEWP